MKSFRILVTTWLRISSIVLFQYQSSGSNIAAVAFQMKEIEDPSIVINDQCEDAIEVYPEEIIPCSRTLDGEIQNKSIVGSYANATFSYDACFNITRPGVWFSVEGTGEEMLIEISRNNNSVDGRFSVYRGSPACSESMTCVDYGVDPSWKSEVGVEYYIHVQCQNRLWTGYEHLYCKHDYQFGIGTKEETRPPPPPINNACKDATVITLDTTTTTLSGSIASSSIDFYDFFNTRKESGVWYQFVGTGEKMLVTLRAEFPNPIISLYTENCDDDDDFDVFPTDFLNRHLQGSYKEENFYRFDVETISGVNYFIGITSFFPHTNSSLSCLAGFELKIEFPVDIVNDQCEGAIEILPSSVSAPTAEDDDDQRDIITGSLDFATASDDVCVGGTTEGVWFLVQGTGASMIVDDVRDPTNSFGWTFSNYTTFSVIESESLCNGLLTCMGFGNSVSWKSEKDVQYYILVSPHPELDGSYENYYKFTVTQEEESTIPPYCFTGDATVQVLNKGIVAMKNLVIGDFVQVDGGKYSEIYSFGHHDRDVLAEYLSIDTGLDEPLVLSSVHMVFSENKSVPAASLRVGDRLLLVDGIATIKKIEKVVKKGAFAPFTKAGTIIVNDIIASCYISLQGTSRLEILGLATFSHHSIAHLSQAPHRLLCTINAELCVSEGYMVGISSWVHGPLAVGQWLLQQNSIILVIGLVFAFFLAFFAVVVEFVLLNPMMMMLGCVLSWIYITNQRHWKKREVY